MWVWYPGQERGTIAGVQGGARLARVAQDPSRKEDNQANISQGESRGHTLDCGAQDERKSKKGFAGWCGGRRQRADVPEHLFIISEVRVGPSPGPQNQDVGVRKTHLFV